MKSKFTHEEKQAIGDRYKNKSESPTSSIKFVGISKTPFTLDLPIIARNKKKPNVRA